MLLKKIVLPIFHFADCDYSLGMVSGYIRQHQILSSSDDSLLHNFDTARIEFINQVGTGWIPNVNDTDPWLEITLESVHRITSIITQGCANEDYWVTSYSVSYMKSSRNEWIDYLPGSVEKVIDISVK